jgi:hypothetical protein
MMRNLLLVLCAALCAVAGTPDSQPPIRRVENQTLISGSLPAAMLTFAPAFKYAGGQRFPLYGVAEAEQHFFVDADKAGNIRRLYWLQFEHFLPDNTHTYDYKPEQTANLGPLVFIHDTKVFTDYTNLGWTPDSDGGHALALLAAAGLRLPKVVERIRMFHLPNKDNRSELMIIYVEALAPGSLPGGVTGETPVDDRFPEIAKATLAHAQAGLTIRAPSPDAPTGMR